MISIKLLTLNTHSLVEENYKEKLQTFVDVIVRELPDIIALQEVNQTCTEEIVSTEQEDWNARNRFYPCKKETIIRMDNHAYQIGKLLSAVGVEYNWTWIGMKIGYGKYDEGMAILTRSKIVETDVIHISEVDDYYNWKTRKIIGVRTEQNLDTWFYSVHMGWWNDEEEPFEKQWERIASHIKKDSTVWLMGDFNSPSKVKGEGYELIETSGWQDSFLLAKEKDSGITVEKVIDGWKDKITQTEGMRIDQIWCNKKVPVKSSNVIFNGKREAIISDHYGIIIEL